MARNMSHNIGSHVLADDTLVNEKDQDRSEIQGLHGYLQQRMDFIAQAVTYTPGWGEPMLFYADLMLGFFKQYLLIEHLTKDTGLPGERVRFLLHTDSGHYTFLRKQGTENNDKSIKWRPDGAKLPADFFVSIPGGSIGMHGLYDILENVMRNSAKYGDREGNDVMEIHIAVTDEPERYKLTLWSSLDKADHSSSRKCSCRVCRMRPKLKEELIDRTTHKLTAASRGVYEMRTCAAILAGQRHRTPESNQQAITAEEHEHDGRKCLSYVFSIEKPHLVGLVGRTLGDGATQVAASAGVFAFDSVEAIAAKPCQLGAVWLDDDGQTRQQVLAAIGKNHHLLPFRLIVVSSAAVTQEEMQNAGIPARRVCTVEPEEFGDVPRCLEPAKWGEFVVRVYELWVRKRYPMPDGSRWQMVVGFDRPERHTVFPRWKEALQSYFGCKEPTTAPLDVHLARVTRDGNSSVTSSAVEYSSRHGLTDSASLKTALADQWPYTLWYDNHGAIAGVIASGVPHSAFRAYNDVGLGASPNLYPLLESPPAPGTAFDLFLLNLLEAALLSVVVVDERVADAVLQVVDGVDAGIDGGQFDKLREAGCLSVFSVRHGKSRVYVSDAVEARATELKKKKAGGRVADDEGLYLDGELRIVTAKRDNSGNGVALPRQADVGVVHQGVIDRIMDKLKFTMDRDWPGLEKLYQLAPFVAITSGRGKTLRSVPLTMPFLEFSIVRENVYPKVSKYHLARALLSTTGGRDDA
jgi:hypothetical protein